MSRSKGIWPITGFADFSQGESRLASESSVEATLTSGIKSALNRDINKAVEKTEQEALAFLLNPVMPEQYAIDSETGAVIPGPASPPDGKAVVQEARSHIGDPYSLNGAGPDSFDCSGFAYYVFSKAAPSVSLGRTVAEQAVQGQEVLGASPGAEKLKSDVKPGDIVIIGSPAADVGICIGDGTGKFIHAQKDYEVKESFLTCRGDIAAIRRVIREVALITGTTGLVPEFAQAVSLAQADMASAGLTPFTIVSGFRSREQQQALYDAYLNGTGNLAAPPGSSKHETGNAIDINWSKLNQTQRSWIEANFPRYGINAPGGGMTGNFHRNKEGWHFEWQGVPNG